MSEQSTQVYFLYTIGDTDWDEPNFAGVFSSFESLEAYVKINYNMLTERDSDSDPDSEPDSEPYSDSDKESHSVMVQEFIIDRPERLPDQRKLYQLIDDKLVMVCTYNA